MVMMCIQCKDLSDAYKDKWPEGLPPGQRATYQFRRKVKDCKEPHLEAKIPIKSGAKEDISFFIEADPGPSYYTDR